MLVVQVVVSKPDSGQRYHMRVLLVPIHDVLRNSRLRADGIQYAVGRMANQTIVYTGHTYGMEPILDSLCRSMVYRLNEPSIPWSWNEAASFGSSSNIKSFVYWLLNRWKTWFNIHSLFSIYLKILPLSAKNLMWHQCCLTCRFYTIDSIVCTCKRCFNNWLEYV